MRRVGIQDSWNSAQVHHAHQTADSAHAHARQGCLRTPTVAVRPQSSHANHLLDVIQSPAHQAQRSLHQAPIPVVELPKHTVLHRQHSNQAHQQGQPPNQALDCHCQELLWRDLGQGWMPALADSNHDRPALDLRTGSAGHDAQHWDSCPHTICGSASAPRAVHTRR